jgi:lysophospholipase L1-like esterase
MKILFRKYKLSDPTELKSMIRSFAMIVVSILLISATKQGQKTVIWVCGDSTATDVPSSKSKPPYYLMGWAQMLQTFFNEDSVEVQNKARSGRSSKSFSGQIWPSFKNQIKKGDYIVIQFGHNDEKPDDRHTEPGTTYKEYLSIYVDHAKKVGAIPILTTPIERNRWKNGNKEMDPTHGDYPEAMRELAKARNITLVDLTLLTREHFEKIGRDSTTKTIFFPGDGSHLQKTGATAISKLFVDDIVAQKVMPVCSWVKDSPCNPTSNKMPIANTDNHGNIISYSLAKRTLYINAYGPQCLSVTVLNLNGKSLLSNIYKLPSANYKIEIPLHGLSRGTYLVKSEFDETPQLDLINIVR